MNWSRDGPPLIPASRIIVNNAFLIDSNFLRRNILQMPENLIAFTLARRMRLGVSLNARINDQLSFLFFTAFSRNAQLSNHCIQFVIVKPEIAQAVDDRFPL